MSSNYYSLDGSKLTYILRPAIIGLFVFSTIDEDKLNHWFTKIYFISIIIYNFFHSFPMISRANLAFAIFTIIVFTWTLGKKRLFQNYVPKSIKVGSIIIIIFMTAAFINTCINPDITEAGRFHPYYFFFENYSDHPSLKSFHFSN
jgi:hypothetical protein